MSENQIKKHKNKHNKNKEGGNTIELKVVDRINDLSGPIIADFKSRLGKNITLQPYKLHDDAELRTSYPEYLLRGQSDNVAFQSSQSDTKGTGYKYLIGVQNKSKNTLTLIKTPQFDTQLRPLSLINKTGVDSSTYSDKNALLAQFGTRKNKTHLTNVAKNVIDISRLENVKDNIKNVVASKVETDSKSADSTKGLNEFLTFLPPYDDKTPEVSNVYPINGIISPDLLELIPAQLLDDLTPEDQAAALNARTAYVKFAYKNMLTAENYCITRMRLIIYLSYLCELSIISGYKTFSSPSELSAHFNSRLAPPLHLAEYLLDKFAEKTHKVGEELSYILSTKSKTHIATQGLILALHLNNFRFPLPTFTSDFKLRNERASLIARGVGCSLEAKTKPSIFDYAIFDGPKGSTQIVLKTPLKLIQYEKNPHKRKLNSYDK